MKCPTCKMELGKEWSPPPGDPIVDEINAIKRTIKRSKDELELNQQMTIRKLIDHSYTAGRITRETRELMLVNEGLYKL